MRAETNSTVSAGSMPLRQAQPAAVVPPDVLGEAEEGSGLGIEHPRAVEAARGFPEQGAGAFQRQEGVHVFDDGVGRHDDGGRFIVPFFLHALEFHGKGVFRVDAGRDGYGANASGHAERRRAGFRAEMPAIEQDVPDRQRFKVVGPRPQAAAARTRPPRGRSDRRVPKRVPST